MTSFEESYQDISHWDTGRPQVEFVNLEKAGEIDGSVLDVGCGTGENALYLAQKGYQVTGVDSSPTALAKAMLKVAERGLKVKFLLFDSLQLEHLGTVFDTIIDSGLFHSYSGEKRSLFVKSLGGVLRPGGYYHMLCFSEGDFGLSGPKSVTKGDIQFNFRDGWDIKAIRKARFEINHGCGWNWAWLASILRL